MPQRRIDGLWPPAALRSELLGHEPNDGFEQFLFGPEVVVERRNVHASARGDVSSPEALETLLGDELVGTSQKVATAPVASNLRCLCSFRWLHGGCAESKSFVSA